MPTRLQIDSGVTLAAYECGRPGNPTIVAVHGYPDNHTVWDAVADLLADRFHVVTYDVRGAGASDKPRAVRDYRMLHLVDDLAAVVDSASPDAPVHLLGHDWGSVQSWSALNADRLAGRVATFTSISGPSLDSAAAWFRQAHRHPRAALRQLAHSYYVAAIQLPLLAELAVRRGIVQRGVRAAGGGSPRGPARGEPEAIYGLALYRANLFGSLTRPRPRPVQVPVQLVVPERDAFVTPEFAVESARPWVADLTVHPVPYGHWVMTARPALVADLVAEFVGARV